MPLGNGRLGIAIWAEDGLTIQLNRADTLPGRLSPGQVAIPGLKRLTDAADYAGRLNLYNGEFTARGNGVSVTVWVEPETDVVIVDVAGARPDEVQSASLQLWEPRHPHVEQQDTLAVLSETWVDDKAAGATGRTFGSLAALTAQGRQIHAGPKGALRTDLSFLPEANGSYRLAIAAPAWTGGDALATARPLLAPAVRSTPDEHRLWWHGFWQKAGLVKLTSKDGAAEYFENLRMLDVFTAAAESRGVLPGSQAGIADLFSSARDHHQWDSSAYWHWNLRMQVAANLGAGLFELNEPYFRLYRDNLKNVERWTRTRMNGRPGICVPETMRFNGQGIETETWTKSPGLNCDAGSAPYYNARTVSTGAEVSLWIWRQYLVTQNRKFLAANYPVMSAAARFLLAYSRKGADGKRHTFPSNAHENQWDVHDPVTDLCAMRTLFPAVIEASQILGQDADLRREAQAVLRGGIPELPRTDAATLKQQLTSRDDAAGGTAIAQSYDQSAPIHNSENLGLEPVWPYGLIGDNGDLHSLGVRTFRSRPNKMQNDWSYDPLDAARLGLASDVKATLKALTEKYQTYPSGLASFVGPELYGEQIGVVAAALQEALVQEYDGLVRIAPAWPADWDADATVFIERNSKVRVRMRGGAVEAVVFEPGFSGRARIRNPWPGNSVAVTSGRSIIRVNGAILELAVEAQQSYVLQLHNKPLGLLTGTAASTPKFLGSRSIGLARSSKSVR